MSTKITKEEAVKRLEHIGNIVYNLPSESLGIPQRCIKELSEYKDLLEYWELIEEPQEEESEYSVYMDCIRAGKVYEKNKYEKIVKELQQRIEELEEIHAKENCSSIEEVGRLLKQMEELESQLKTLQS